MTADGTPGPKGNPQFLGGGAPSTAPDLNTVSAWAANNIDRVVATAAALPPSGNYSGKKIWVEADSTLRVWTGSAWVIAGGVSAVGAFTPGSGYTVNPNSFLTRRADGLVVGYLNVTRAAGIQTSTTLATLPVGFRPAETFDAPSVSSEGGAAAAGFGRVATTGAISTFAVGAGNQRFAIPFSYPGA